MKSWKNSKGQSFDLSVTVNTVSRCKRELDVDILNFNTEGTDGLVTKIVSNPEFTASIGYLCAYQDVKSREIDPETFADGIEGDSLLELQRTVLELIADFSPNKNARELIHETISMTFETQDKAMEELKKKAGPAMKQAQEKTIETVKNADLGGMKSGT